MATTERRRSISLFFGFGKQEPKPDSMPDGYPKLRRKLQKVSKQIDAPEPTASTGGTAAPAPDVGGVQTVTLPGDDQFLATKYDASRPPPSRGGSLSVAAARAKPVKDDSDKRARRDSKLRFFSRSRSSSTSRVPDPSPPAALARVTSTTALPGTATRPGAACGETAKPPPAYLATAASAASTARPAPQVPARVFAMVEEHERISAQHRSRQTPKTPPSASRTKLMAAPPRPPGVPLQQHAAPERSAARPFPQFHRPYSHAPYPNTAACPETDVQRTCSTAASRSACAARKPAGLAPVTVPSLAASVLPLSPTLSSPRSDSSASVHSPTSAAFNISSASLALTAATSVNPSCSTLPLSAHGPGSSRARASPDGGSVAGSFPYAADRRARKYDLDSDSCHSSSGSSSRGGVVPELSYLSASPAPGSPSSVSSVEASSPTRQRRKVKTPVYAIGQLEGGGTGADAAAVHVPSHDAHAFAAEAELSLLQSKSSIECIAEEYRALLASRNSQTSDAPCAADTALPRTAPAPAPAPAPAQRRFELAPAGACRDDALLRPDACAQDPLPPPSDNLGLQICVDLLTRELSSAIVRRSSPAAATAASQRAAARRRLQQAGTAVCGDVDVLPLPPVSPVSPVSPPAPAAPDTDNAGAALQILVMIEAYERLRDQLVAGPDARTDEIEAMFGLWLKTLYRIHDTMTDAAAHGEDLDDEEEEDDDDNNDDDDFDDNELDNSDYDSAAESI